MPKIGQTSWACGVDEGEKAQRAEQLHTEADRHDQAPVEAVGGEPGDEDQHQRRQEQRQPDEPEQERPRRVTS